MQFSEFQAQAHDFLDRLFEDMARHKVEIPPHWKIDHLCYRVDSLDRYNLLKKEFSKFGRLLIESEVNGRPIATYKLNEPISFFRGVVDVVELPAPKTTKPTREGFEHIEIVVDVSFAELQRRFSDLPLDCSGLKKEINPELELCLGERNIKFHHQSLEEVISQELSSQAHS